MPRQVQLQIFKRSFSTKGAARGLGTYSMRLLSERYLKGVVSFTGEKLYETQVLSAVDEAFTGMESQAYEFIAAAGIMADDKKDGT